ncbi:MAG: hypothetical protein WDM89_09110 [Rhizomicrobium sp.]
MGAQPVQKHWLARIWFFLNDSADRSHEYLVQSRNMATAGAILGVGLVFLTAWMMLLGSEAGLPRSDRLHAVSGQLTNASEGKNDIWITLEHHEVRYDYISKENGFRAVWDGLCAGCQTTLWIDPGDTSSTPTVFQIAVKGRMVRSYADVKAAWISDNRLAPWLFGFFIFSAVYLAFYARRQHRRLRASELP